VARLSLLLALTALALAPAVHAGGPELSVGAAEDVVKQPTLAAAEAQMQLLRLAGLDTVRITAIWQPGLTVPAPAEAVQIRNAVAAASLHGVKVIVAVYHESSATTPLTDESRAEFAAFATAIVRQNRSVRDLIVGNEPNLNRFWLPQFDEDGVSAAPAAYLQLLVAAYDSVKAAFPKVTVWGGSVSPRGTDRPFGIRPTHSPTTFIRGLGTAYRASGRALPVMDGLAIHPYGDNSSQAPGSSAHPGTTSIGLADYDKLVALLGEAFDGTAQPGSTLPLLYDEYGVETTLPADKAALYTGVEPDTTKPVAPATQGKYYREAIAMAFCQPNVRGIMLFHTVDEMDLNRWQSGLFYLDGKAKASLGDARRAADESRRGVVAVCPGLALTPRLLKVVWPKAGPQTRPVGVRLLCSLDCTARIVVQAAASGRRVKTVQVAQIANALRLTRIGKLPPGRYLLRVTLRAALNAGPPLERRSPQFAVG
jgi:hypothetical protein